MLKISKPKTRKQLRSFIGKINYYRDMWQKRSEVLEAFTELTSATAPWEWKEKHNKAFNTMEKSSAEKHLSCIQISPAYSKYT